LKHIALFGGSFDPPHLGHQALVEAALSQLQLDELWIIPVGLPIHKTLSGKASAKQRFAWLQTMFAHHSKVKIMDWEQNQASATPAIHTLRHFHQSYPQYTPTWLMGMDSFLDLPHWVEYPAHQRLCNLAVFQRKGTENKDLGKTWTLNTSQIMPTQAGHIMLIDVDLPDISASEIRQTPHRYRQQLPKSTCNAILACYASPQKQDKRELYMTETTQNNTMIDKLTAEVIEALGDKKGQDIITLDVTGRCSFADRFILATGRTDRQIKALANGVRQIGHSYGLTARVDGLEGMEWLVIDLGDVVVHVFLPEVRESFQLERLWSVPEGSPSDDNAEDGNASTEA